MLDLITALGVAGNVIQIIDFGLKAISKAREIHHSADGTLKENVDLEVVATDLTAIAKNLEDPVSGTTGCSGLDDLCGRALLAAKELLDALEGLKISGQKSRVKSARKALKAIWGKSRVEEMKTRLEGYRDEMQFHILVSLRLDIDAEFTRQLERFDTLDEHAKSILEAISEQKQSVEEAIQIESVKSDDRHTQTVTTIVTKQEEGHLDIIQTVNETRELVVEAVAANGDSIHSLVSAESSRSDERHRETTETIVAKYDETHTEVIESLQALESISRTEQEAVRRGLEQLKQVMAQIEQDRKRRDDELKELLQAFHGAYSTRERKNLQERSKAVSVAVSALATTYESLQEIVSGSATQIIVALRSANIKTWVSNVNLQRLKLETENVPIYDLLPCGPVGSELDDYLERGEVVEMEAQQLVKFEERKSRRRGVRLLIGGSKILF